MKKIIFAFLCVLMSISFLALDNTANAQVGKKYYYKKSKPRRGPHNHRWVWTKRREYVSFGLSLNAMNYFGDIVPKPEFWNTDLNFTRPNIGVFVQKRFRPQFSGRLAFNWGRLRASDEDSADPTDGHDFFRYIRNAHFRNDIYELTLTGVWDLASATIMNQEFYRRPKRIIPYITGGVSVFYHSPQAMAPKSAIAGDKMNWGADEWTDLQELGTEGQGRGGYLVGDIKDASNLRFRELPEKYSKIQVGFPLGAGLRKRITNRIDIAFEVSYRFLLTDYLDDVSNHYVDMGVFEDDALARAFHDRSLEGDRMAELSKLHRQGKLVRVLNRRSYKSAINGQQFNTFDGFGGDYYVTEPSIRGDKNDNDAFIVTGIHLTYIIPPHGVRCPVRFR